MRGAPLNPACAQGGGSDVRAEVELKLQTSDPEARRPGRGAPWARTARARAAAPSGTPGAPSSPVGLGAGPTRRGAPAGPPGTVGAT